MEEPSSKPSPEAAAADEEPSRGGQRRVLVVQVQASEADRSRPKRSRDLALVHLAEKASTRLARRGVKVLDHTLSEYRQARGKSAERERDGALVSMPHNLARAGAAGLREAANIPVDLSRTLDRKATRKAARKAARAAARALRRR